MQIEGNFSKSSQVKSRSSSLFSVFSVLNSYFLCIHSKWTNHYDHTLPKVEERYSKILQRDKCMSVKPSKRLIFHNQLYTSLLRSQLLQMLLSCFSMYCWFLLDIQVLSLSTYSKRWHSSASTIYLFIYPKCLKIVAGVHIKEKCVHWGKCNGQIDSQSQNPNPTIWKIAPKVMNKFDSQSGKPNSTILKMAIMVYVYYWGYIFLVYFHIKYNKIWNILGLWVFSDFI